jgi:hypothetical protein
MRFNGRRYLLAHTLLAMVFGFGMASFAYHIFTQFQNVLVFKK